MTVAGDQCFTISGTLVAGGVLRLRWVRTMPSMMVMPMPGRSPSATLCKMSLPAECCALSMMTAVARRSRPGIGANDDAAKAVHLARDDLRISSSGY